MKPYAIIGLMLIALVIAVTLSAIFGSENSRQKADSAVYGAAAYLD